MSLDNQDRRQKGQQMTNQNEEKLDFIAATKHKGGIFPAPTGTKSHIAASTNLLTIVATDSISSTPATLRTAR